MKIAKDFTTVTAGIPRELRNLLADDSNKMSIPLSRQVAHAIEVYLEQGGCVAYYANQQKKLVEEAVKIMQEELKDAKNKNAKK